MAELIVKEEEEEGGGGGKGEIGKDDKLVVPTTLSRKKKRKERKKMKRKQVRREMAEKEKEEEEVKLNDLEEQRRVKEMEEEERQRMEQERMEFEERERKWLEDMEKKREEEEEEERRKALEEEEEAKRLQVEKENECNEDDDWEYIEKGPAEIVWQGNEIIVRKKRVKVLKKNADGKKRIEVSSQPTSNPLPPQSEAFADYQISYMASAEQMLENVAQQVPNFGTEQDKDHCPFHLKTGACRFGQRCSRVHFYPNKACTLLMKNMYNGPGLAWEQDEGLEYTDEEVERCYEEFYEDVHTEFLKYGAIVNFKVCKNSSFHLRGNVYVQYKSLDSATLAYHSINGRYFAGKQVQCEFVNVTRWKVAICGEYLKSRLKTCSRGNACNFIHCFHNLGGDYEWADWDKPPPRYWVKKMAALFGYTDESTYGKQMDQEKIEPLRMSTKKIQADTDRIHSRRSRSSYMDHLLPSGKSCEIEYDFQEGTHWHRHRNDNRKWSRTLDEKSCEKDDRCSEPQGHDSNSDGGSSDRDFDADTERNKHNAHTWISSEHCDKASERSSDQSGRKTKDWIYEVDSDEWSDDCRNRQSQHACSGSSGCQEKAVSLDDNRDRKNEFHEEDGYKFDRDRDREKHYDHTWRSSRHQSKVKSTDDLGNGKESSMNKSRDNVHPRRKSSRLQNKFSDDHWDVRHRISDIDSNYDWLDRDEERYQSHIRRRSRQSDQEVSDGEGVSGKRLKKNAYGEETELEKSHLRRKKTGSHLSRRSHSSRKSLKTRENHGSRVDHHSNHKSTEELNEQDRWKPESPDRDQNSA